MNLTTSALPLFPPLILIHKSIRYLNLWFFPVNKPESYSGLGAGHGNLFAVDPSTR